MAGAGPPPKPEGMRRRRNVTTGKRTLPAAGSGREAPPLPGAGKLLKSTREWWATVWASPMAAAWVDADAPALARLAGLVDRASRGQVGVLDEIRQLEDRFGLSPLARRRLEWEIEQTTKGEEGSASPQAAQAPRWLRVVGD